MFGRWRTGKTDRRNSCDEKQDKKERFRSEMTERGHGPVTGGRVGRKATL